MSAAFMTRAVTASAFAVLFLLPLALHAQEAPPKPSESVVVMGPPPDPKERSKIVWDFVQSRTKLSPRLEQLTRWAMPVCPVVQNLAPEGAAFVVARIKAVAAAVGAPVRESCRPNVEIVFTDDPQGAMREIAATKPALLGYHYLQQTDKIATVVQPVQAWYVTQTGNENISIIDDPYHSAPSGTPGSRLSRGLSSSFANILILADSRTVNGQPLPPLADYLAMLSLSAVPAGSGCIMAASILDLMVPDCGKPTGLTETDKTYLQGLYSMNLTQIGSLQKSAIAEHMLGYDK
jgi:hypothetical protein